MGKDARTLVIGLDGVSFNVLTPLIEKGLMPNIKQIMDQGGYGDLLSTVPPFTAPAWASFITGLNPANHGVLSFTESETDGSDNDQSQKRTLKASDIKGEKLWDILSAYNKRIIVINVPLTYAPEEVNGVMVTGMMTPSQSEDFTYPSHLKDELKDYLIDVTLDKGDDWLITNERLGREGIYKKSVEILESRERAVLQLMEQYDWDFLMVVFTATDRVLHFLWEYFDSNQNKFKAELETFFQYLDKVMGKVIGQLSESDNLLIISDHGFDKAPQKALSLDLWMNHMGWLKPVSIRSIGGLSSRMYHKRVLRSMVRKLAPRKVRNYIRREIYSSLEHFIDRSRAKAYYVPMYSYVCGIMVNRDAMSENDAVTDEEYEAFRDEIIRKSLEIIDPDTRQQVIEKALRREEVYSGELMERIPDVIIFLKPEYMGSSMLESKFIMPIQRLKTGDHKEEGIFIFAGPNAQKGHLRDHKSIADIAPTICHLMGVPVSEAYDGKVIEHAIRPQFMAEHPVQYRDISQELATYKKMKNNPTVDEDTETVKERLKALGYL